MPPNQRAQTSIGNSIYASAVLVDTGAFIALAINDDTHHQEAIECSLNIMERRLPVLVGLPTIYETYRKFLFNYSQSVAIRFIERVYGSNYTVIRTLPEDESEAIRLIQKYASLRLTLTDAANMAIMKRLKIARAFSFDAHFFQVGFMRIPPFQM